MRPAPLILLLLSALMAAPGNAAEELSWVRAGQPSRQAQAMLATLAAAGGYGLDPADYRVSSPPSGAAAFDRELSGAIRRFVNDLHRGRIEPRQAGFNLPRPRDDLDMPSILAALSRSDDVRADLAVHEPPYLHYQLLKRALLRYRALSEQPGLTRLPRPAQATLDVGQSYAGAPALRALLAALGDLDVAAGASDTTYDAALAQAVRRFQERHGLAADGRLGRRTFAALTTPLAQRVRQLEWTLERWRWLPELTQPPIIVNIPQFRLFAFRARADRVADILQLPVIVGQANAVLRTPVFVAELQEVVIRPYWDVPRSILRNELLAPIRADPGYLVRNRFQLVHGEGDDGRIMPPTPENIAALAAGQLRLRQLPGADNALGLIKFVLPNPHGVYLHGTPAPQLFAATRRDFSHGCIRVSDPAMLAVHVLRNNDGDWSMSAIERATHGADSQRVRVAVPIPVLVLYGTALATEDGRVMFFDDIYGHDRRLARLLAARS